MSFLRVSNPVATAFDLKDLGITIAASASNIVLSNQFSVDDLYLSADLEAAVIAGDLTIQIDYGTGFTSIAAIDYTNRDAISAFLNIFEITNQNNNEDLVDGSDASALHNHDSDYFTETELGSSTGPTGGSLIGLDDTAWASLITFDDVQEFADDLAGLLTSFDLDDVYTNDVDGIMRIDDVGKQLSLRSNNVNDINVSREIAVAIAASTLFQTITFTAVTAGSAGNSIALVFDGVDDINDVVGAWNTANPSNTVSFTGQLGTFVPTAGTATLSGGANISGPQDAMRLDVSGDELLLGSASVGSLNEIEVRVLTNLIVDGNLTVTGTVTDTTVDELNVTNANIRLRDGATAIAGADSYIEVERGTSGNDARLLWNEATDRWQAGIVGDINTIALLEKDEIVTGVYEMQGGGATEPSMYLTDKASAPTVNLGSATQIPMTMINNTLAVYDKTNSRNRFLSVNRMYLGFTGRDNANNANEYARFGDFTSNQSSARLMKNMTLVGMSVQTNGAETWTARVRKNGVVTNLASLAVSGADGAQASTYNVDFNAGDKIDVFIDGTSVDRPIIMLEFAERF